MQTQTEPINTVTSRHSFTHRTLVGHITDLQREVLRLRDDNLQLRAALSIYSDLARQSLVASQQS